ncbi:flagellar motor protein MotA [Bdellovibrio bacteriovorus]|uniref:Flagellar motor protein MotA n=1 Tax=Bdellovibrio bacteriovorus TaxID=959 RepID=A0A150WT55_BDEBC|nr:flagellar motor protein [Bdellovibrio bacteriovorus]KYG67504.1 flagellar motor protein MotA [Bdellovibrio bacteriovorus]
MDKATWLGLLIGFGGIIAGNLLEGGHMSSLMQLTAFIIVIAGTVGAVMVSSSEKDLKTGVALAKTAFKNEDQPIKEKIEEIVDCARLAKKESLLALEARLHRIQDPMLKGILRNVVDGVETEAIRDIYETQIQTEEEELLGGAKIWVDAGGYAPTIGIIGAVLGLIHVMGNLTDTSKLGGGIAVAFVATVYGVASANLLFLPLGSKLKRRVQSTSREKQMILEGGLLIASGMNPVILEQKLFAFLHKDQK